MEYKPGRGNRKSGLEYNERNIHCCYSCIHCTKADSDGRGVCALDGEKKYIYFKNYCTKHVDAGLILCLECNKWFRSLQRHIHTHGLTVDEYKEKHGYNRTTGLVSQATSSLYSKYASEEDRFGDSKGTHPEGCKGLTWKLREEGIINFEKNLEARGGYDFIMKMVRKKAEISQGVPISEEHRKKISEAHKGILKSKSVRRKISYAIKTYHKYKDKTKIDPRSGVPLSEEHKRKIAIAVKEGARRGPLTEEHKMKISLAMKEYRSSQKHAANAACIEP